MNSLVWQRLLVHSCIRAYPPRSAIWQKVLAIAFARIDAVWRTDPC
jgi:hypothetical protein